MKRLQRIAAATALAGAGTLALSGVASATESHGSDGGSESSHGDARDRTGLVSGVAQGVGGLLGGVGSAAGSVLGSDAVGDVVDGLL